MTYLSNKKRLPGTYVDSEILPRNEVVYTAKLPRATAAAKRLCFTKGVLKNVEWESGDVEQPVICAFVGVQWIGMFIYSCFV